MLEHTRALLGTAAYAYRRDTRWRRHGVLAGVVLGHGLLLGLLAHVASQHLARDGALSPAHPTAPLATTMRLVVQLLPLASAEAPRATEHEASFERSDPAPAVGPAPQAQRVDTSTADATPRAPAMAAPVEPPPTPGVHFDNQTLRRAMEDAETRTVRGLAKRAGRLDEVERLRADPLSAAMASAGRTNLRDGSQARIAQEDACKQELGKSGVGEKNRDNDRDTFMSTYIGAGKDCKQ